MPSSRKSNVFQDFFNGNQVRFSSEFSRSIRSDSGAAVTTPPICAHAAILSSEKAALGASSATRASCAMNPWQNKRLQRSSRKSSQRIFAISRFWWHCVPFFMTRQNQKGILRRNFSNSPIFAEPTLSATSSLALAVDRGTPGTAQIGQYLRKPPLSKGATGWAGSPGTCR
jgi:hypothetical protein